MVTTALARAYAGKRVLVTGHTGFKGGWMSIWLQAMGAAVYGYALAPTTVPALFDLARVGTLLDHRIGDIRDVRAVSERVAEVRPDIVFHMAAQPLVRESYRSPLETLDVNVMGTANLLEAVRRRHEPCAVVIVTSDKCYDNREWVWGYRETDPMGGHDPYSMSKGAAELVTQSWRRSFFSAPGGGIRVASARAGNVIGGGDWAPDRILTDCIVALAAGAPIRLRNPSSTRPWQHVLEPVGGYLWLGARLAAEGGDAFADGWNFGPQPDSIRPASDLADLIVAAWGSGRWEAPDAPSDMKEALSLSLDCAKAAHALRWKPTWTLEQCVARTIDWYKAWGAGGADMLTVTREQLVAYERDAAAQCRPWAQAA